MNYQVVIAEIRTKLEALEQLLIIKGVLTPGEPEKAYGQRLQEHLRLFKIERSEFWERIDVGDWVRLADLALAGTVISKSQAPWGALVVKVTERNIFGIGRTPREFKKNHQYEFEHPGMLLVHHIGRNAKERDEESPKY